MLLTATSTSTSLADLITTAWYSLSELNINVLNDPNNETGVWLEIKNKSWNTIYVENILEATTTTSRPIAEEEVFSIDCRFLNKLNVKTATTQEFYLTIT